MSRQRPAWNREPDYWIREKERLAIVEGIKSRADSFSELAGVCPGCGHRIWQASAGALVYRGCHCMTFCFPPGHPSHEFDPERWADDGIEINCKLSLWNVWWFELQLGRTAALISRLKAHLEKVGLSQVTLSKELGISPAALSEVMRGKNSPNSETTLHIIEIIEPQSMKTIIERPDWLPQTAGKPGPKTLTEARERIEVLEAQLLQLHGAPASTAIGAPGAPATRTATSTSSTAMIINPGKPLSEMTEIEKLRAQLNTAAPEQRDQIYRRIKQLEGDTSLRAYKAARK